MRVIPEPVAESWKRLAGESALGAVTASRALHRAVARWQADLVREALTEGATWEHIGEALGTTRQAAWARFRTAVASEQGGADMEPQERIRQRITELWDAGQARLRDMDAHWQEEQERLREDVREGQDQLREAKRRHDRERHSARQELRRSVAALRATAS